MYLASLLLGLSVCVSASQGHGQNSTFYNPIFPGFYPDPSCIYVPERDHTFFCASSSFNAFPGIPIHATKDLQNWKLIGHVLNRREQLLHLAETNRSTSGIWAPALRFHDDTFWLVTTLVDDDRAQDDSSRWDNIIFKARDPYNPKSWSNAVHFNFTGYDTEPFWEDGKAYITGAHAWKVGPYIQQAEVDLDTGATGEWRIIWNGTGGMAPEGPHIYRKDGWYYLLAAEGGTGVDHMVTMARSKKLSGPYESYARNPVLSNANTTSYFQTVGHSDLFHDRNGNWWAVALSTRSGPEYLHYPMGRETVMTAVSWPKGDWPTFTPISGKMSGWPMPPEQKDIPGVGPFVNTPPTTTTSPLISSSSSSSEVEKEEQEEEHLTFPPTSRNLPAHLLHWRYPLAESYTPSPPGHPHTLRLLPSRLNLTALNGNYAGPGGQTLVARRQQHTLFGFEVVLGGGFGVGVGEGLGGEGEESGNGEEGEEIDMGEEGLEAGVTVFLTQNHHLDLGVVLLPLDGVEGGGELVPHVRFRGESYTPVPAPVVFPVPEAWRGGGLVLEIRACNASHYAFGVGPEGRRSERRVVMEVGNEAVSWGFTGALLGIYATTNGGNGSTPAYFSDWRYKPIEQFRD